MKIDIYLRQVNIEIGTRHTLYTVLIDLNTVYLDETRDNFENVFSHSIRRTQISYKYSDYDNDNNTKHKWHMREIKRTKICSILI